MGLFSRFEVVHDNLEKANTIKNPGELPHKISLAFDILEFNQNLIQFADNKANTIIVINSIFLASLSSISSGQATMLKAAFFMISVLAIIYCLRVVTARKDPIEAPGSRDLIFFEDIISIKNAKSYLHSYMNKHEISFLNDISERIFKASLIAHAKYQLYSKAQRLTFFSCLLWITCMLASYLRF